MNWQEIITRIFEIYGNLPKNKLADRLGINKSVISQWTTDNEALLRRPTWEVLRKVIEDTGVTWDWLLSGKDAGQRENTKRTPVEASGEQVAPSDIKDSKLGELLAASMNFQAEVSNLQQRVLKGEITVEQFGEVIGRAAIAAGEAMNSYGINQDASKSG